MGTWAEHRVKDHATTYHLHLAVLCQADGSLLKQSVSFIMSTILLAGEFPCAWTKSRLGFVTLAPMIMRERERNHSRIVVYVL